MKRMIEFGTFLLLILFGLNNLFAEQRIVEYTDNEYDFAFQFASDWKMQKVPGKGEMGEVRVLVKGARANSAMAVVGIVGNTVTKKQFNDNPNRNVLVEQMIDFTIEQTYKKMSREIKAKKMIVSEKKEISSEAGIKFYISTLHSLGEGIPFLVCGIHVIPFGRGYIINFVMTTIADKSAKKKNEVFTKVLNSFHLIGEKPR